MERAAKVLIEITAGLLLKEPIPKHTKQFIITSLDWKTEDTPKQVYDRAQAYLRHLWDSQQVNWVQCNWIYL